MQMTAFSIDAPGRASFVSVDKPVPGAAEALVRVAYVGLSGADIAMFEGGDRFGRTRAAAAYPVRPGSEFSGVVEAVGPGESAFAPGDRVTGDAAVSCGGCTDCLSGRFKQCASMTGLGTCDDRPGALAQYVLMPQRHLTRLPDSVSLENGALMEPAGLAWTALGKRKSFAGEFVALLGTGPVGLCGVALAKAMGAGRVIMIGRRDEKLAVASAMGAGDIINLNKTDPVERVREITCGHMADLTVDCTGSAVSVDLCVSLAAHGGTMALPGFYEVENIVFDVDRFIEGGASMTGVVGRCGQVGQAVAAAAAQGLDFTPVVTDRFSFERTPYALETAAAQSARRIKALVRVNDDVE